MQVTNDDADYLGLGSDTGIGSERYHFLDKPHQFVRRVLTEHADMRAAIQKIEEGTWECGCESIGSHACDMAEIKRIAREVLASLAKAQPSPKGLATE